MVLHAPVLAGSGELFPNATPSSSGKYCNPHLSLPTCTSHHPYSRHHLHIHRFLCSTPLGQRSFHLDNTHYLRSENPRNILCILHRSILDRLRIPQFRNPELASYWVLMMGLSLELSSELSSELNLESSLVWRMELDQC